MRGSGREARGDGESAGAGQASAQHTRRPYPPFMGEMSHLVCLATRHPFSGHTGAAGARTPPRAAGRQDTRGGAAQQGLETRWSRREAPSGEKVHIGKPGGPAQADGFVQTEAHPHFFPKVTPRREYRLARMTTRNAEMRCENWIFSYRKDDLDAKLQRRS